MTAPATSSAPRASDRHLRLLGWVATATAIFMYLSYVDQIRLNLAGDKGSTIQPVATVVNCALWVSYGWFRDKRDWPIVLANFPGVLLGLGALVTAV